MKFLKIKQILKNKISFFILFIVSFSFHSNNREIILFETCFIYIDLNPLEKYFKRKMSFQ